MFRGRGCGAVVPSSLLPPEPSREYGFYVCSEIGDAAAFGKHNQNLERFERRARGEWVALRGGLRRVFPGLGFAHRVPIFCQACGGIDSFSRGDNYYNSSRRPLEIQPVGGLAENTPQQPAWVQATPCVSLGGKAPCLLPP